VYLYFKLKLTPKVMYYGGESQKVHYFGVYVTLGSKFGSFLIIGTKNDVRYFEGYVIFGGTLLWELTVLLTRNIDLN
jgi:hypothetical protein